MWCSYRRSAAFLRATETMLADLRARAARARRRKCSGCTTRTIMFSRIPRAGLSPSAVGAPAFDLRSSERLVLVLVAFAMNGRCQVGYLTL